MSFSTGRTNADTSGSGGIAVRDRSTKRVVISTGLSGFIPTSELTMMLGRGRGDVETLRRAGWLQDFGFAGTKCEASLDAGMATYPLRGIITLDDDEEGGGGPSRTDVELNRRRRREDERDDDDGERT